MNCGCSTGPSALIYACSRAANTPELISQISANVQGAIV